LIILNMQMHKSSQC